MAPVVPVDDAVPESRLGPWLVLASAVVWSFGGTFARLLDGVDAWTVVFWRSIWAASFLLGFMLVRDGPRGTRARFAAMGIPGLAVAILFATASTSFVVALEYTTVANILLVQAGVPLIAGLIAWAAFGERLRGPTWAAIAVVLAGVAIMVSPALTAPAAPVGDLLALWIAFAFATATVIIRRFAQVRMTPAVALGVLIAAAFASTRTSGLAVAPGEMALLIGFGALNFGLGLALFVTGAPLIPAATAALLGVAEVVLAPVWVWLFMGEVPAPRTLAGGGLVLGALIAHLTWQLAPRRTGVNRG
jgi:drug/metabolite transporter (DMT)-like permease